jgi:hypothetical protein
MWAPRLQKIKGRLQKGSGPGTLAEALTPALSRRTGEGEGTLDRAERAQLCHAEREGAGGTSGSELPPPD